MATEQKDDLGLLNPMASTGPKTELGTRWTADGAGESLEWLRHHFLYGNGPIHADFLGDDERLAVLHRLDEKFFDYPNLKETFNQATTNLSLTGKPLVRWDVERILSPGFKVGK